MGSGLSAHVAARAELAADSDAPSSQELSSWSDALARMAEATGLPIHGTTEADFEAALLDGSMLYALMCSLGLGKRELNELLLEHVAVHAAKAGVRPEELLDPSIPLKTTAGLERARACVVALHKQQRRCVAVTEPPPLTEIKIDVSDDLAPLKLLDAPCRIDNVAERSISLAQLEGIEEVVRARCAAGKAWWDWDPESCKLVPKVLEAEEVNLYHFVETVSKPATQRATPSAQGGSLVEWMSTGPQKPDIFVSHFWGDPVLSSVACMRDYMVLRGHDREATRLWVCAHANDQHDLSNLAVAPRESPFFAAIGMSSAVLALVDARGDMLTRAWCVFEAACALEGTPTIRTQARAYDIVTRFGHKTIALTAGPVKGEDAAARQEREGLFPPLLAARAISFDLGSAKASKPSDLSAILDDIGKEKGTFEATVRARFFLSALPAISSSARWLEAGLRALRSSRLTELYVDFASVAGLPELWADELLTNLPPTLVHLELEHCELSVGALTKTVRSCPALQALKWRETLIASDGNLAACARTTALAEISFAGSKIGDQGAIRLCETVGGSASLSWLDLDSTQIGDVTAVRLGSILDGSSSLTELSLSRNEIGDQGTIGLAKGLVTNVSLTKLSLSHNKIGDRGAIVLAKVLETNTTLVKLDLLRNAFGVEAAEVLVEGAVSNSGRLVSFCGIETKATSASLKDSGLGPADAVLISYDLWSKESMLELNLSDNRISDGAVGLVERLKLNTSLTTLSLKVNQICDAGAIGLGEALGANTSLTELKLHFNRIGVDGALGLSKGLELNKTLISLGLSSNAILADGAISIGKALSTSGTRLADLNLSNNQLGDRGAAGLADSLKGNFSLTELWLSENGIADAGAVSLGEYLEHNSSLLRLYLTKNQLGDEGAVGLGCGLKANKTLTYLNVSDNRIGDAGARGLCNVLERVDATLAQLRLHANLIGDAGNADLSAAVEVNTSLLGLTLTCNNDASKLTFTSAWCTFDEREESKLVFCF